MDIEKLPLEQLLELNKRIIERIHPRFLTKIPGPRANIPQDIQDIVERHEP